MYEPYYDSKQERWRRGLRILRGAALGTLFGVGVSGVRTALARGVMGAAMVVTGILAVGGGDSDGVTESRSGVVRAIGRVFDLAVTAVIVVGGWLLLMEK